MRVTRTTNEGEWEEFLRAPARTSFGTGGQPWSPFLQSWAMGEVYRAVGEEPVRLVVMDGDGDRDGTIVGICQAIVVPAKRGRHLAIPYGPVFADAIGEQLLVSGFSSLVDALKETAREKGCSFIRMSPFWETNSQKQIGTPEKRVSRYKRAAVCVMPSDSAPSAEGAGLYRGTTQTAARSLGMTRFSGVPIINSLESLGFRPSPLHMLAEHIWYLDLRGKSEEDILRGMRQTTRNLIRRAEREGVVVESSDDPVRDLPIFFELYEETRKRHRFVPYPQSFIQAQVERFAPMRQCALYIARFRSEPVAASIHMIYGGETSYHHGASAAKYPKVPASHLLQWRAIQDALRRGDRVYNFWGIAPLQSSGNPKSPAFAEATAGLRLRGRSDSRSRQIPNPKHPFAGVTTFKTGFGGQLLTLRHCMDLPLSLRYWITFGVETLRKWKRGF